MRCLMNAGPSSEYLGLDSRLHAQKATQTLKRVGHQVACQVCKWPRRARIQCDLETGNQGHSALRASETVVARLRRRGNFGLRACGQSSHHEAPLLETREKVTLVLACAIAVVSHVSAFWHALRDRPSEPSKPRARAAPAVNCLQWFLRAVTAYAPHSNTPEPDHGKSDWCASPNISSSVPRSRT